MNVCVLMVTNKIFLIHIPDSWRRDDAPRRRQSRPQNKERGQRYRRTRDVDVVEQRSPSLGYQHEFGDVVVDSLRQLPWRREVFTTLNVLPPGLPHDRYTLRLKIDTGASGNTLPLRVFRQMYGKDASTKQRLTPLGDVKLSAYNGQCIPCFGTIEMKCRRDKRSAWDAETFYVVDVDGHAVVGLPMCERLHLVTINIEGIHNDTDIPPTAQHVITIHDIGDLKAAFPQQFDKLGNFPGTAALHLKDDAEPFIDAPRKCSVHIKDKLKAELDSMLSQKVIRKVDEHPDWCSSLAFTTKKDGSIRIFLEPKKLNDSLKRCPHKIPTLEELNPEFANARVFSKLDAKAGYRAVHFDEDSQLLTMFRTPFGRYCWQQLPFGLCTSQDIFQARMDEILEGLRGVLSIADDVCVHGKDATEHDENRGMDVGQRVPERGR